LDIMLEREPDLPVPDEYKPIQGAEWLR
jgi:hypothetical protein